ncbi:MFS transporter [Yersinia bercovieri]|uniref:MFS transporter n=1 Tax=Yersinia bercovieri TaxID=634 RepID=UPI0011A18C76|nr:MFS transporter [Yersinia bercovieri]
MSQAQRIHPGVLALAVTAFAIGIAEFIVVGILPSIASDFNIPLSRAGGLVGLYALSLAIGTPVVVLALARLPRKPVLLALIAIFLVGNLLSALSTSYTALLMGRIITAVAHGSFFAIGATVCTRLVPEGQASRAIALMFAGLTLAIVVGVPVGSLIGNTLGWRLPFYAVVLLSVTAFIATILWVPALPVSAAGNARAQLAALTKGPIIAMMSVTVLSFGASFAAFTFITPILTTITGFTTKSANLLLLIFGVATLLGNLIGGRLTASRGWSVSLGGMFAVLLISMVMLALLLPYKLPMVAVIFVWGVLAFGISPALQSGMLATAERWSPRSIDFASALNISAFNLGITLGETAGSAMVAHNQMALTPWAGVALVAIAQLPLAWLVRKNSRYSYNQA